MIRAIYLTCLSNGHTLKEKLDTIEATLNTLKNNQYIFIIINILFLMLILLTVIRLRKMKAKEKLISNRFNPDGSLRFKHETRSNNIIIYVFILFMTNALWHIVYHI